MPSPRIHHINFVVRDLAKAATMFEHLLGLSPFEFVDHSSRGAKVARSPIGDAWFVLVCPYDPDSVPGRFLAEHGEGLDITLVESPDVPTIGVGEGTWPSMRETLRKMGVSENSFFAQCDASFKQGSKFIGWKTGEKSVG